MAKDWEVRSMDEADIKNAVEAAKKLKMSTAAWLGLAIREKLGSDREPIEGEIIAPGQEVRTMLVVPLSIAEIGEAFRIARENADARGRRFPDRIGARINRLIAERLTAAAADRPARVSGGSGDTSRISPAADHPG